MFDFIINWLIEHTESLFGISRDAAVGALVTIILALLSGIGMLIGFLWKKFFNKGERYRAASDNMRIIKIKDIAKNAPAIMAERGKEENGFDKEYFERPAEKGKVGFDEELSMKITKNAITILCGIYGMGKSRAVFHFLQSDTCKEHFNRVVVLKEADRLSCSFVELKEYIEFISDNCTLIYIDNLHNRIDKDNRKGLAEWKDIFASVRTKKSHIVVSCLDDLTPAEKQVLQDTVNIDEAVIKVPDLDHETYKKCRAKWHNQHYSPIIGNYVDGMENFGRLVKKLPLNEGELLLLSVYLFINNYFTDRGKTKEFLEKTYAAVCGHIKQRCKFLGNELLGEELSEDIKQMGVYKFTSALRSLTERKVLINNGNIFNLYDEIFADEFARDLCSKPGTKNTKRDLLKEFCSALVLKRNLLLYQQEQWLASLIIDIDPTWPELYMRVMTRATSQNERKISLYVQKLFDKQFLNNYSEELLPELNQEIGIFLSRSYDNWKEYARKYIKAGILVKNDPNIVSELLRIAADDRTSSKGRQEVMTFIAHDLGIGKEELNQLVNSSIRIAINYEAAMQDICSERIANMANQFDVAFAEKSKLYKTAYEDGSEIELVAQMKDEMQMLMRDLRGWAKIVTHKVDHPDSLQNLMLILHQKNVMRSLKSIVNSISNVGAYLDYSLFSFLSTKSLGTIAQNIYRHYPLCYMDCYKQCIDLLCQEKENIIVSRESIAGFFINADYKDNVKDNIGALVSIGTVDEALELINVMRGKDEKLREKGIALNILDDSTFSSNDFYATCVFIVCKKINNTSDFEKVRNFIDERYSQNPTALIGGKIKLYQHLLIYAPLFSQAIELIESDTLKNNLSIHSINSFICRARDEYRERFDEYRRMGRALRNLTNNNQLTDAQKQSETNKLQAKRAKVNKEKEYIIKQVIDKAEWAENSPACKWDAISISMLRSWHPDVLKKEFSTLREKVLKEVPSKQDIYNAAQDWKLDFDTKMLDWKDLNKQLTDRKKSLEALEAYFVENPSKQNDAIRLFTSDNITNLMQTMSRFLPKKEFIMLGANFSDEMPLEEKTLFNDICDLLHDLIVKKQIDNYFVPTIFYYEQAHNFAFYNAYGPREGSVGLEQRWQFIKHALERLAECKQPLMENEEERLLKGKLEKNLMESMLPYCSFDDACELVRRTKEMAKTEIYRPFYRPEAIKMLCNRLRKDLEPDEQKAMETLTKRIEKINDIISDAPDHELILMYDSDTMAPLIATANSLLRGEKNDKDRCFPDLEEHVRINLPIASKNDEVRHKTWDMYAQQNSLDKLASNREKEYRDVNYIYFLWSEMEYLVQNICENQPVDLHYLMELLYIFEDRKIDFSIINRKYWAEYKFWQLARGNYNFEIPTLYDFLLPYASSEQKEDMDYMNIYLQIPYVRTHRRPRVQ